MPTLKNILVNPDLAPISDEAISPELHRAELRTIGLMCYTFCEARTHKAIANLPGVSKIDFQTNPDRFIVDYDPRKVGFTDFRRAYVGEVVGRPLRAALGKIGNRKLST